MMKFKKPSRKGLIVIVALVMCSTLGSHHSTLRHEAAPTTVAGIFGNLKNGSTSMFGSGSQTATDSPNTRSTGSSGIYGQVTSRVVRNASGVAARPVMQISGTLTGSQIWTAAYTYEITDTVIVPNGVSLTIGPGVVIKNNSGSGGIVVANGGTLSVSGGTGDPVIFTSTDNGTPSASPQTAQYQDALVGQAGSTVTATDIAVAYADTAFVLAGNTALNGALVDHANLGLDIRGGSTNVLSLDIENTEKGANVTSGQVVLRGAIHATRGVSACDVGSAQCSVDAAYVDWGIDAEPASTGIVCGNVIAAPWLAGSASKTAAALSMQNCSTSPTPGAQLATSEQAFATQLATQQTNCTADRQDANGVCNQADTMLQCVVTALQPFAADLPTQLTISLASPTVSAQIFSATAAYLSSQAERIPLATNTPALTSLQQISADISNLATAYTACM